MVEHRNLNIRTLALILFLLLFSAFASPDKLLPALMFCTTQVVGVVEETKSLAYSVSSTFVFPSSPITKAIKLSPGNIHV